MLTAGRRYPQGASRDPSYRVFNVPDRANIRRCGRACRSLAEIPHARLVEVGTNVRPISWVRMWILSSTANSTTRRRWPPTKAHPNYQISTSVSARFADADRGRLRCDKAVKRLWVRCRRLTRGERRGPPLRWNSQNCLRDEGACSGHLSPRRNSGPAQVVEACSTSLRHTYNEAG